METREYIELKKGQKVFMACNDYFGYFGSGIYKMWNVKTESGTHAGETFALTFADAVNMLHEYIKENDWVVKEHPKAKFSILMIDGKINRFDEVKYTEVYSISVAKAKKLLF